MLISILPPRNAACLAQLAPNRSNLGASWTFPSTWVEVHKAWGKINLLRSAFPFFEQNVNTGLDRQHC